MPAPSAPPATDLPAKLRWYYARLFPLHLFTRWLRFGSDQTLSHREISFTLAGDIYIRWKSFTDHHQLLQNLKTRAPVKIDIGAVYNQPPANKHALQVGLAPVQKELVFDIDITDYEDVINHAPNMSATQVCDQNWQYMALAARVIDAALRQDFGFRNIMWVYSGRRGIHCWVADHRARFMTNEQRSAVADYLHLRFEGRDNRGRRQTQVTSPLHPSLKRAKRLCEPVFAEMLVKQRLLDDEQALCDMLQHIPNGAVRADLLARLRHMHGTPLQKWQRIEKELNKASRSDFSLRSTPDYIVFRYTYPRLDVNVSREMNHLLKAPFCVHPKTGRVCVPFRVENAEQFEPHAMAPQLDGLLAEIESGAGPMSDRLNEAVAVFEQFVHGCEQELRDRHRRERLDQIDRQNVADVMKN